MLYKSHTTADMTRSKKTIIKAQRNPLRFSPNALYRATPATGMTALDRQIKQLKTDMVNLLCFSSMTNKRHWNKFNVITHTVKWVNMCCGYCPRYGMHLQLIRRLLCNGQQWDRFWQWIWSLSYSHLKNIVFSIISK